MPQPKPQCVRLLTAVIGAFVLLPQIGAAQVNPIPLELLDLQLGSEQVRARTLSVTGLVVLDELDIPRLREWDGVLLATQAGLDGFSQQIAQTPMPELVGWAVLADGQRHRVWPNPPASADPDVLDVTLADGTEWSIPLDQLRALIFFESPLRDGPGLDDTVRLANGDAISGFVESIGGSVIVDSTRVPLDRVASITLANPAEPPRVMLIDLADGSVVGAVGLGPTDHGRVSIQLALTGQNEETSSPRISVEPEEILAIRPVHDSVYLLPMASLEMLGYEPLGGRRWSSPPKVSVRRAPAGLRTIDFPGPMEVVYDLPEGATWFRARAGVAFGEWSEVGLELLIERPGGERERLDRVELGHSLATGVLAARIPSDAVRLVIRIDAGERGPVQDGVVLRSAALVIEN